MKLIRLLNWSLEVDVGKTKEFYEKDIELCKCLYCKNYMEAVKYIDPSIIEVFTALGINPSKPSHLSEFGEMENGLRLYIGSYHLVGNLIEGEYCTDSDWTDTNTSIIGNFTFGLGKELVFVHDELPRPVLQLDFEARIYWVLNEKPED
ncbi:hypothetical protein [Ornithinibacillus halotolerans]|uniref:Uncharacterized protein n=1 Tax=Ornithinibacillus halotolerans TaxID=1274357 RepID=A0A916RWY9_9BACI|nr:hypothetical protein [Ornithinibacillus halotolerans]GGA74807.1 hypothetical protein GCM10008025_18160 [Ornithinibacillus halotolerans]